MASESDSKKLNELRVVDLRSELEKRDLDKTGVKAVLIERLQKALEDEGHDPESYVFDLVDIKKTPTRGKKSDNEEDEEKADEDKADVDEGNQTPKKVPNKPADDSVDKNDTTKAVDGIESEKNDGGVVNSNEIAKESNSVNESKDEKITECIQEKVDSDKEKMDIDEPKTNEKLEEVKKESEPVDSNKDSSDDTPSNKEAEPKSSDPSAPATKEDKTATEANGINDNEDSINLTIGEDEEKLVADEDDISQEKYQKDESHGTSGQKKAGTGAKSQDKSNQEKTDGRSSTALDKSAKDEKNKKLSSAASASKNLWVSGLATTTRATDLKQVFSKFGKVIGAKVVTNARTPGARCYGYVTMSTADDANKAVTQLHHTELHGRLISVEKAKGDSTGPPKRVELPKTSQPAKKVEEKKQDSTGRKVDIKKDDIVPPGTEGEVTKEPAAPGTEDVGVKKEEEGGRRAREPVRTERHSQGEKRPHSQSSGHRNTSRGGSPVLTFEKIKEERERQRLKEKERILREEERRREIERIRQREVDRKQREEFEILEREKRKLKMEKERVMREKEELIKLRAERQRLERERQKLEREKLEKEKEELERLKRQNMRLEEEARRKRSLSASREREYERSKRPAPESRYIHASSSSSSQRFEPPSRSTEYKKEVHKVSTVPRRPGFDPPESSRRMVTSLSSGTRDGWQSKDRDSGRYERTSVNSSSFREDSRSKPTESRHVRERYADGSKGERFVERASGSASWSSGGGGSQVKPFGSSRDTWTSSSSDRKVDHMPEPWSRPSTNANRWAASSSSIGLSSRPQSGIAGPMFTSSGISMPSMGISGMSNLSSFSSGDRFDAYKQPYFKGP